MPELKCFHVAGEPNEIGLELGAIARPIFDAYMAQSVAWQAVSRWRGHPYVQQLRAAASAHFPAYVAELDGMAAGLGWPAEDVFLWNCRGELIHNSPDGCTTLAAVNGNDRFIAHNEDGDPYLRSRCFLVDLQPVGKPGFVSFCYPGSLPGHTFAASRAGIAQTINNVRIRHPSVGVPRMVLTRAVLDAASLDEALKLLRDAPRASGYHHTLGFAGDGSLVSVEATVQRCSVVAAGSLSGHTNHLIHEGHEHEAQIITDSSRDRQARLAALLPALDANLNEVSNGDALLRVLQDRAPTGLPIYRDDPHDPDDENTLATVLFCIARDGIAMQVHEVGERVFERFIPSIHGAQLG